jgi:hypothetical protein
MYGTLDKPGELPPKGEFFCRYREPWMPEIPGKWCGKGDLRIELTSLPRYLPQAGDQELTFVSYLGSEILAGLVMGL